MNIEELIKANTAALTDLTSAIRDILVADRVEIAKTSVKVKTPKVKPVTETPELVTETPELVTETPELVTETPELVTETPELVTETPELVLLRGCEFDAAKAYARATLVKVEAELAFITEDINTDAVIASIIEAFKDKLTGAVDAERKNFLKEQYSALRTKYDLGPNDKLAVLKSTPEKLVSLHADIEAL